MNCRKTQELATGYAMNELDPGLSDDVKQHIASCPDCRARVEEIKATLELLRSALAPDEAVISHLDKQHIAALESALEKPANDKRNTLFYLPSLRIAAVAVLCVGLGFLLYFWKIQSVSRNITAEIRAREVAFSYRSGNQLKDRRTPETRTPQPETPATSVKSESKPFVSEPGSDFSSSVKQPMPRASVPERLVSRRPSAPPAPETAKEDLDKLVAMRDTTAPRQRTSISRDGKLKMGLSAPRPDSVEQETIDLPDEFLQVEAEIMSTGKRQDSFNARTLLSAALPALIQENERQPLAVEFAKIQNPDRIIMLAVTSLESATKDAPLLLEIEFDTSKTKSVRELGASGRTQSVFEIDPAVYQDKLPVFVFELQPVNPDDPDTGTTIKLTSENKLLGTAVLPAKQAIAGIDSASAGLRLAYCIGCYADALKKPDTEKQAELMKTRKSLEQLSIEYPDSFIIVEILDLVRASLNVQ